LPAACYSVNLGETADLSWIASETGKQGTLGAALSTRSASVTPS